VAGVTPSAADVLDGLHARLLSLGGTHMASTDAAAVRDIGGPLLAAILADGRLFDATGARMRKGGVLPGHCHDNCEALARRFQSYEWWIGFALGGDGGWFVHSWIVTPFDLIETSVPRVRYFGLPEAMDADSHTAPLRECRLLDHPLLLPQPA
jgi:hypothetical protein